MVIAITLHVVTLCVIDSRKYGDKWREGEWRRGGVGFRGGWASPESRVATETTEKLQKRTDYITETTDHITETTEQVWEASEEHRRLQWRLEETGRLAAKNNLAIIEQVSEMHKWANLQVTLIVFFFAGIWYNRSTG